MVTGGCHIPVMKRSTAIQRLFADYGLTCLQVSRFLGVSRQSVLAWRTGRNRISPAYAKSLNAKYGLPLHVLRPDVWDAPGKDCSRRAA